jgi:hypothetical protein
MQTTASTRKNNAPTQSRSRFELPSVKTPTKNTSRHGDEQKDINTQVENTTLIDHSPRICCHRSESVLHAKQAVKKSHEQQRSSQESQESSLIRAVTEPRLYSGHIRRISARTSAGYRHSLQRLQESNNASRAASCVSRSAVAPDHGEYRYIPKLSPGEATRPSTAVASLNRVRGSITRCRTLPLALESSLHNPTQRRISGTRSASRSAGVTSARNRSVRVMGVWRASMSAHSDADNEAGE